MLGAGPGSWKSRKLRLSELPDLLTALQTLSAGHACNTEGGLVGRFACVRKKFSLKMIFDVRW